MYHRFERIKNYIEDNEFRVTLFEDRIHVMNYVDLISIGSEKIMIQAPHYQMYLYGKGLVLAKLLDQEILITGKMDKVEISYEK